MSRTDITYLVAGVCGVAGAAAFVGLILLPAVSAYTRMRERLVAVALSLYVLAAMLGIGTLGAYGIVQLWARYG